MFIGVVLLWGLITAAPSMQPGPRAQLPIASPQLAHQVEPGNADIGSADPRRIAVTMVTDDAP